MAARLAVLAFPELLPGMEMAAALALKLIDKKLERVDEIQGLDFAALEDELKIAAQQHAVTKRSAKRKNS